jgi:hypothetical protein
VAGLAALAHELTMPALLNNPPHWHLRAEETRLLASQLIDPKAKATVLKIADEYDRLGGRSRECKSNERKRSTSVVSHWIKEPMMGCRH